MLRSRTQVLCIMNAEIVFTEHTIKCVNVKYILLYCCSLPVYKESLPAYVITKKLIIKTNVDVHNSCGCVQYSQSPRPT